jgi:hypothetical protein
MTLNKKNKFLIGGFVLALYVCYAFAISNTLHYYQEYHSKNATDTGSLNPTKIINNLSQKENQLDSLLAKYNIATTDSFQSNLLKQLNLYSDTYRLKIIDFKEPHIVNSNGLITTSYIFSLEGSFNGSLELLSKLENNPKLGSIKYLYFSKKRNYKTNVDQLFTEVILQKNKID